MVLMRETHTLLTSSPMWPNGERCKGCTPLLLPLFFILLLSCCEVPWTLCYAFGVSGAYVGGSRGKITMLVDSPATDQFRIGYLSDIEVHWDYFL